MRRVLAILALLALILGNFAATPSPRVVIIRAAGSPSIEEHLAAFNARLSVRAETASLAGDTAALARSLRERPPQLVFAVGTAPAEFAARAASSAPLLFSLVYAPEAHGLAGRKNTAGLSLRVPPAEVLKALGSVLPGRRLKVGALYQSAAARAEASGLAGALAAAGHTFLGREVAGPGEVGPALAELLARVDVLWLLADPAVIPDPDYLRFILKKALDRRVAVVGLSENHVRLGALLSVSVDYRLEGAAAADLANQLLAGEVAERIGVRGPQNLVWSINTRVAADLGITVPGLVLRKFEKVYP